MAVYGNLVRAVHSDDVRNGKSISKVNLESVHPLEEGALMSPPHFGRRMAGNFSLVHGTLMLWRKLLSSRTQDDK